MYIQGILHQVGYLMELELNCIVNRAVCTPTSTLFYFILRSVESAIRMTVGFSNIYCEL
jgi:hypothetical protein